MSSTPKRKRSDKEGSKPRPKKGTLSYSTGNQGSSSDSNEAPSIAHKEPKPSNQTLTVPQESTPQESAPPSKPKTEEDDIRFLSQLVSLCNIALATTSVYLDIERVLDNMAQSVTSIIDGFDGSGELEHLYGVLVGVAKGIRIVRAGLEDASLARKCNNLPSWRALISACDQMQPLCKTAKEHSWQSTWDSTGTKYMDSVVKSIKAPQWKLMIAKHGLDPDLGCASYENCADDVRGALKKDNDARADARAKADAKSKETE